MIDLAFTLFSQGTDQPYKALELNNKQCGMYVFTMFGQRPGSESLAVHTNKEIVT